MPYGPCQFFSTAVASAASTAYFDLGKSYTRMAVFPVSMTTNGVWTVYGSHDAVTYKPVHERVNTATVQHQALTIATATSGSWAMFDGIPFRYVAFACDATVTGGGTIRVMVDD